MAGPHDTLFKEVFGHPEHAAEHFERFLPRDVVAQLDLTSIERVPDSFVDESMRSRHTDLLFRVGSASGPLYLYVLHEHQSTVDRDMPLRMLRYMTRIWDRDRRVRGPGEVALPPVIPMVLYHGARPWSAATRFEELVLPPERPGWTPLRGLTPHFGMLVLDLGRLPDERIGGVTVPGLVRLLFKHLGRVATLALLRRLSPLLKTLFAGQTSDLHWLRQVIDYVYKAGGEVQPLALVDYFTETVGTEARAMAMTAYQIAVEEGRAEGEAAGRAEGEAAGRAEGEAAGRAEGEAAGRAEGEAAGRAEGEAAGKAEGIAVARRALAASALRQREGSVDPQRLEELLQLDDDALAAALSGLG